MSKAAPSLGVERSLAISRQGQVHEAMELINRRIAVQTAVKTRLEESSKEEDRSYFRKDRTVDLFMYSKLINIH
jgi:hypothetical protein